MKNKTATRSPRTRKAAPAAVPASPRSKDSAEACNALLSSGSGIREGIAMAKRLENRTP
jgi:hypothetical protein